MKVRPVPTTGQGPTLRVLMRRSKDEGQEFSLDVQRELSDAFAHQLKTRTPPVPWKDRREYVDDDVAGDDFMARVGLRQLMDDLKRGDVVVCRDHTRLGRDALEVTIAVREIVQNRGARLFYANGGQEVEFKTALDAATVMIQGVGAQMELEGIRSRTRDALRMRVRQGFIAGGRCYGYDLVRVADPQGRSVAKAIINEQEAATVREIFQLFLSGLGLTRIAGVLNDRGIAPPSAGRRGCGWWSPGAIREILRRERYRGVYVHGVKDRVRRDGKRKAVLADPSKVVRVEIPEWRIIDEPTWEAVQKLIAQKADLAGERGPVTPWPHNKYMLSGIAKCMACQQSIGVQNTTRAGERVRAYGCAYHQKRGSRACPEVHVQPIDEVDGPLADYIVRTVLAPEVIERFVSDVLAEIEREDANGPAQDLAALEAELTQLRGEQRRLAAAVASAPDVPELVGEMRKRGERIRILEAEQAVAQRAPSIKANLLARLRTEAHAKAEQLRATLSNLQDADAARDILRQLFPEGLWLKSVITKENRRAWAVEGTARLDFLTLSSDPTGNRTRD
jgi:site-specific DNA recombinase